MAAPDVSSVSVDKAVEALKAACDEAYAKYGNSCSHAVWHVLAKIIDKDFVWRDANHLIEFLSTSSTWKEVDSGEGWQLAQKGVVVVGGLAQTGGHGHVMVIYPGEQIDSGGYLYTYKDKKTGLEKKEKLRSHGVYPRALSTSIGSWPGAMSKGDKTIWDPWASDDIFEGVGFWTRK
jgi:hypothetical protein